MKAMTEHKRGHEWFIAKVNPRGLTFFSDAFYPAPRKRAKDVLVFIRTLDKGVNPAAAKVQIANEPGGMIRQLTANMAAGAFEIVRPASRKEIADLEAGARERKMEE